MEDTDVSIAAMGRMLAVYRELLTDDSFQVTVRNLISHY